MHLGRLANSGAQCCSNLLCCLTLAPSRWMGFWLSKALHPVASAPSCCTSVINDSWAWFLHLWWIWLVEGRLLLHSPYEKEQFYPWSTSEHKFLPCSPTCWDTAFMVRFQQHRVSSIDVIGVARLWFDFCDSILHGFSSFDNICLRNCSSSHILYTMFPRQDRIHVVPCDFQRNCSDSWLFC